MSHEAGETDGAVGAGRATVAPRCAVSLMRCVALRFADGLCRRGHAARSGGLTVVPSGHLRQLDLPHQRPPHSWIVEE